MSTNFPSVLSGVAEELQGQHRNWGWFLPLGVALIVVTSGEQP